MQIAILTLEAFNELDSFISAGILNRMRPKGWRAFITSPRPTVASMNGVTIHAERDLGFASKRQDTWLAEQKQARPQTSADWRPVFRHAPAGQAGIAGRAARVYGRDHETVGGGRSARARPTLFCRGEHRDGRQLFGAAVLGDVGLAARGITGRCRVGNGIRSASGRESGILRAGAQRRGAISGERQRLRNE